MAKALKERPDVAGRLWLALEPVPAAADASWLAGRVAGLEDNFEALMARLDELEARGR